MATQHIVKTKHAQAGVPQQTGTNHLIGSCISFIVWTLSVQKYSVFVREMETPFCYIAGTPKRQTAETSIALSLIQSA